MIWPLEIPIESRMPNSCTRSLKQKSKTRKRVITLTNKTAPVIMVMRDLKLAIGAATCSKA